MIVIKARQNRSYYVLGEQLLRRWLSRLRRCHKSFQRIAQNNGWRKHVQRVEIENPDLIEEVQREQEEYNA